MVAKTGPIGLFDSGVGGLSIAAAIRPLLPSESLVYYADRDHFPYGDRTEEEVQEIAAAAASFLIDRGAKLVVVACNTASSVALSLLRSRFDVPFVGIVPGVKPAILGSGSRRVGVLATAGTLQTRVFAELVQEFAGGVELVPQVCPELVALVEAGEIDSPRTEALVARYVRPLLEAGVDAIVLGCTHYHWLDPVIQRVAGPGVATINTAVPVACQVKRVLEDRGLMNESVVEGDLRFYATGDSDSFLRVLRQLWPDAAAKAGRAVEQVTAA